MLCSTVAGLVAPISNTFAKGASSYFDGEAKACIIENYNAETSSSVTDIEEVDFSQITTLNCSNRGIWNFRGITLFPNLETLDLSYNSDLQVYNMNFSQNTKLKSIDVRGLRYNSFNFVDNTELETIITDRSLSLTTAAYVKRIDEEGYQYGIDLSVLKFLDSSSVHEVWFPDKDHVTNTVSIISGGYTHQVYTRGGWANYLIYINGDSEVETHSPIYLNNNCEVASDGYYSCNNSIYYGDVIDTNSIVENTIRKIFNLSDYSLSKVEIAPPTANVELTVDTDTVKKGIALADSDFTLRFYFDLNTESGDSSATTPETGVYTSENGGAIVANIATAVLVGLVTAGGAFVKMRKSNMLK